MPTNAALEAYYDTYYDEGAASDGDRVTVDGVERFGAHIAALAGDGRGTLRVLDFGGGDGSIAIDVARRMIRGHVTNADVTIVDFHEPAPCPPSVWARSVRELDDVSGAFDLIIASAILEHVPAAGATLAALVSRLAPGGTFYARTPWMAPLARLTGRIDLSFPGHVHDLGAPFWDAAVSRMPVALGVVASRPSIIENAMSDHPARAALAWVLKAPAHAQRRLGLNRWMPTWPLVGGWEVAWRRLA
jgi:SAM-dependent methyltransferase